MYVTREDCLLKLSNMPFIIDSSLLYGVVMVCRASWVFLFLFVNLAGERSSMSQILPVV